MIGFADETTRGQVWEMWKTVFGDPDACMEIYFRYKYRDENTLLRVEDGKVVASLQMLPYRFTFCGTEIPILYLSGVSSLPEYRKRGYVRQLLMRSFEEAARRDVALMLLIPQEEWLLEFYGRYGFAQTFDAGKDDIISLKELTCKYPGNLRAAFDEFNALFRKKDMTVQKSFDDFRAIVEDAMLYGFPPAGKLIGMARAINAERLLSLFAHRYERKSFSINVQDRVLEDNNAMFSVMDGIAKRERPGHTLRFTSPVLPSLTVDIKDFTQLLLGYHTSQKGKPFNTLFPEKQPQMHFMLE